MANRGLFLDILVDGDDVDVSVKESITEDDTADTTCALTPQIPSSSVTNDVSQREMSIRLTETVTSTNDSAPRLRKLYDIMKEK